MLGGELREHDRIHELGVLAFEVGLRHPTGDRAGPSDMDRDASGADFLQELWKRREANPVDGLGDLVFHQVDGLAEQPDPDVNPGCLGPDGDNEG